MQFERGAWCANSTADSVVLKKFSRNRFVIPYKGVSRVAANLLRCIRRAIIVH